MAVIGSAGSYLANLSGGTAGTVGPLRPAATGGIYGATLLGGPSVNDSTLTAGVIKGTATPTFPPQSVVKICGASCNTVSSASHWTTLTGTGVTVNTSGVFPGGPNSFDSNQTAAAGYLQDTIATTTFTGRVWYRVDGLPGSTGSIFTASNANGACQLKMATSGQVRVAIGTSGDINTPFTAAVGQVFYVDFMADASGANAVFRVMINGSGVETVANSPQVAANFTTFRVGVTTAITAHVKFGNIVYSTSPNDFPWLGGQPNYVKGFTPIAQDGGATLADFQTDASVTVTNGDGSWSSLTEFPPDITSYVKQTTLAVGANVKYRLAPPGDTPTAVNLVVVCANVTGVTTTDAVAALVDTAGTVLATFTTNPASAAAVWFNSVYNANSGGSPWTLASAIAWDVLWGQASSGTGPPFITAALAEADFPLAGLLVIAAQVDSYDEQLAE